MCRQSGRSFQQELTNKSGLVVQNFLALLDTDIAEDDLVEKVLQMFSDIPTTTQAIQKLKDTRQGEGESILAYNQKYKALVERVEGKPIELITSPVAMEMYLGTIIPPIRKSIKNSIFWNSKHAPTYGGRSHVQGPAVAHKTPVFDRGMDRKRTNPDQRKTSSSVKLAESSKINTKGDEMRFSRFVEKSTRRCTSNGQRKVAIL